MPVESIEKNDGIRIKKWTTAVGPTWVEILRRHDDFAKLAELSIICLPILEATLKNEKISPVYQDMLRSYAERQNLPIGVLTPLEKLGLLSKRQDGDAVANLQRWFPSATPPVGRSPQITLDRKGFLALRWGKQLLDNTLYGTLLCHPEPVPDDVLLLDSVVNSILLVLFPIIKVAILSLVNTKGGYTHYYIIMIIL